MGVDPAKAVRCRGGKESSKRRTGGRATDSSTRNGVIAAKVRRVEKQGKERDSMKAVWCKGSKDARKGGTDNGEILRRRSGAKAARSRAKEERAVERQVRQRRNSVISAKV